MSLLEGAAPIPAQRNKWKLIVPIVLTILILSMYGCWRGIMASQRESAGLLDQLHQRMNAGNYDAIYTESDPAFKKALTSDDSIKLFAGIEKKLGPAGKAEAQNTQVQATTSGKYITTVFATSFANDSAATERVTWHKDGAVYRLEYYSVNSTALLR